MSGGGRKSGVSCGGGGGCRRRRRRRRRRVFCVSCGGLWKNCCCGDGGDGDGGLDPNDRSACRHGFWNGGGLNGGAVSVFGLRERRSLGPWCFRNLLLLLLLC
jgi:hypothetical protein